jgi:hypothetical protein
MSKNKIMETRFSKPHKRGEPINFSKIFREEEILQALNKIKNRKPGEPIIIKLKRGSFAPLSNNNDKKRLTQHKNTPPKSGTRIFSARQNTSHLRKALLTRVNNKVNFYSRFPELIKLNFKNEKNRNNLQKKINVYWRGKKV